jgi:uncharacterized protein YnzC (UPF0291/DUF896 family)
VELHKIQVVDPQLEDVFIALLEKNQRDNHAAEI